MTMVPARNLLQQQYYTSYGACMAGRAHDAGATSSTGKFMLRSDPFIIVDLMAEDESRTSSFNDAAGSSRQVQEEKEGDEDEEDNNHNDEERDMGWLQLGLGSHVTSGHRLNHPVGIPDQRPGLIELELFSDRHRSTTSMAPAFHVPDYHRTVRPSTHGASTSMVPALPLYLPQTRTSLSIGHQPEITWGYRHGPWDPTASSSSSMPFYSSRPFQHPYMSMAFPATVTDVGPSSNIRIIDPPPRQRSGLWFVLQASQNQGKEPFLPQIPKSYLRIKDGRMTVGLLMKYLSNKLGLNNESEVEITCKGQQLPPFLTLQHVRDNVWCTRDAFTLLPDSPTVDHVMILHYGRST
ncbi:uncharacterized protein LOC131239354 [Magnolia sinica]|uniref:uncharacterized protein LOC131239354 n=1 Tax=Magnolia sinica TaxID=86752 RepID=UPI00265A8E05|nr:uncharacterized protein LOC131239354 [Magnolia sinica]